MRFGFPRFERFCAEHGTELLVLIQEEVSPGQEMVQDLLTVVQCFSAPLWPGQNYRKKVQRGARVAPAERPGLPTIVACRVEVQVRSWRETVDGSHHGAGMRTASPNRRGPMTSPNAPAAKPSPWGSAFANFFRDCKNPRKQLHVRYPQFKKKRLNQGLGRRVDQFDVAQDAVQIPKAGWVRRRENVEFCGVIMGSRPCHCRAAGGSSRCIWRPTASVIGPRRGRFAALSKPAKAPRQEAGAEGVSPPTHPSVAAVEASRPRGEHAQGCGKQAADRPDVTFETAVIEKLNVSGMANNRRLAGDVVDCVEICTCRKAELT